MTSRTILYILTTSLIVMLAISSLADPCGMVPPISLDGPDQTIERVGEQKTYVFRKGDLQTVVIHPGFTGNVDQFGMLIPFPDPPSLRKVPDNTFEQLEKAIVPPTISYWIRRPRPKGGAYRSARQSGMVLSAPAKSRDRVVVLKEEAVGMYEVAVLEAGSAAALKRWMTEHSYRFPDGMESTCQDYVKDGWCFVAVKTRVGRKAGVEPRPGMRVANPQKPKGSNFNGKVQAMGFRFRSENFEVPMRLSAFNGGDFHNIIYIVADQPVRASNLPKSFVTKQVSGEKLYSNVTDLLPYKLKGGTEDDMSPNQWKDLNRQRDPKPHNGVAAQLFAHDLLADQTEDLTHSFEEREKLLLDIGETLDLRGARVDQLNAKVLDTDREEARKQAIGMLKDMTFTMIEGDFPAEVLANENIKFKRYERPKTSLDQDHLPVSGLGDIETPSTEKSGMPVWGLVILLATTGIGGGFMLKNRPARVAMLCFVALLCVPLALQAKMRYLTTQDLILQLDDPKESKSARAAIRRKGKGAIPFLLKHLRDPAASAVERGYCLTLLTEHQDPDVARALAEMASKSEETLVKLWSRAALIQMAENPEQILRTFSQGSPLDDPDTKLGAWNGREFPELQRPVALKLKDWDLNTEEALRLMALSQTMGSPNGVSPTINQVVAPQLRDVPTKELISLMFESKDQNVRRLSAGLLANTARKDKAPVLSAVGEALALTKDAKTVPWAGGALFIPQFTGLSKTQSTELIGQMVRWSVWTQIHETPVAQVKPLENNLRSYNLWSVAGGSSAGWRQAKGGQAWLAAYSKIAGQEAAKDILLEQGVSKSSDFWSVVRQ